MIIRGRKKWVLISGIFWVFFNKINIGIFWTTTSKCTFWDFNSIRRDLSIWGFWTLPRSLWRVDNFIVINWLIVMSYSGRSSCIKIRRWNNLRWLKIWHCIWSFLHIFLSYVWIFLYVLSNSFFVISIWSLLSAHWFSKINTLGRIRNINFLHTFLIYLACRWS